MKEDINYSWLEARNDILIGSEMAGRTIPKAGDSGLETWMSTYGGLIIEA